jgi:alpha-N-arabinofuranosidase
MERRNFLKTGFSAALALNALARTNAQISPETQQSMLQNVGEQAARLTEIKSIADTHVAVSNRLMNDRPVSPKLFSGVIELAFGRSDLISAELLLDRGFEMPPGFSLNDDNGWCARSKPTIEQEDWWHSGYEEHPWQLSKSVLNTAASMTRAGGSWPHAPNGRFYLRVENPSTVDTVALTQDGVWIYSGVKYDFSGLLCDGTMFSATPKSAKPVNVEVCLYPEGRLDGKPLSSTLIVVDSTTPKKFTAALPPTSYTGRTTFAMRVPPGSTLVGDMLSLRPGNRIGAIRSEVIEGMKQVPVSLIRFPGGCFASTYRWRDGIGDRDSRPVDFENWWNVPMQNDIGTVEFLEMCKTIGSEPMFCVPVMFNDAYNAADWVAFCNTDHHPLLAKAGLKRAPMKVKYWELDNETYRRMDAITYAHKCVEFSRAMKKVDPTIKIIMDCYWVYHSALGAMLQIAGGDIDLVNNRGGNIAELGGDLVVLADYNRINNRDICLCHSEYRANNYDLPTDSTPTKTKDDGLNSPGNNDDKDTSLAKASRWSYGLSVLCDYLDFQGFGGGFQFANFTGYTDGWGEGLINCAKSRVYPSAAGEAFNFLHRQGMTWPLAINVAQSSPLIRTQAAWDAQKQTLILFALNLSSTPRTITWDLASLGTKFEKVAQVESLSSPTAHITIQEDKPNPIIHETAVQTADSNISVVATQPFSATAVRLRLTE